MVEVPVSCRSCSCRDFDADSNLSTVNPAQSELPLYFLSDKASITVGGSAGIDAGFDTGAKNVDTVYMIKEIVNALSSGSDNCSTL